MKFIILFTVLSSLSFSAFSQESVVNVESEFPATSSDSDGWFQSVKNNMKEIFKEGQNDLYITMYAYHDRWTYTKEKLRDLNEGAYGFGIGRSKINANGNTERLYAMTHLDSHSDVQVNAGYGWTKDFEFSDKFRVGIGYSAGLASRSDMAHRIPIPFILPLATVQYDNISLNAILIPKLNDGINNGNVLFFFAKYAWDQHKY